MMKQIVTLAIAVVVACSNVALADETRAEVTLNSGEVISGTIKKYWFGPFKKKVNTDMSIVDDSGQEHKLSSDDFVRMTTDDGQEFETSRIAVPALFKTKRVLNWILGVVKKNDCGTVYWHNVYNQSSTHFAGTGSMPARVEHSSGVASNYSVKFAGDSIAYPFYFPGNGGVNFNILAAHVKLRGNPELAEFIKSYMKENKELKKAIENDPALVLDIYSEYKKKKQN